MRPDKRHEIVNEFGPISATNPLPVTDVSGGAGAGGKRTPAAPATITGAATGTLIAAANAKRKSILIQNLGANPLYLGKDNTVSATVYTLVLMGLQILVDDQSDDAWYGNTTNLLTTNVAFEEISTP